MTTVTLSASNAGCWLDGANGWHNSYRIIDLAIELGWKPADGFPTVTRFRDAFEDGYETIFDIREGQIDVSEAINGQGGYADQATDYLNTIAPAGYVFVWSAGDLSMIAEGETSE